MVKELSLSDLLSNISQQDMSGMTLDWFSFYPLVGCMAFMLILTLTCFVSKKLIDRRLMRKKLTLSTTEIRQWITPDELPYIVNFSPQPVMLPNLVVLNPVSPVIKPEHVMVLKVDSLSTNPDVKTTSNISSGFQTSSNVSSDVRTSYVAISIALHDQSYDNDGVFISDDNLVPTPTLQSYVSE